MPKGTVQEFISEIEDRLDNFGISDIESSTHLDELEEQEIIETLDRYFGTRVGIGGESPYFIGDTSEYGYYLLEHILGDDEGYSGYFLADDTLLEYEDYGYTTTEAIDEYYEYENKSEFSMTLDELVDHIAYPIDIIE